MAQDTKIEWTHHTWNPWRGCTKVSPGCAHCYADAMAKRNPDVLGVWGPNGNRVVAAESYWRQPLKWNREAEKAGERRRVFCASMADWLEDWKGSVKDGKNTDLCVCHACGRWVYYIGHCECGNDQRLPRRLTLDEARARLLKTIHLTPHLDWLLLTKRPEAFRERMQAVAALRDSQWRDIADGAKLAGQWLRGAAMPNIWAGCTVENQEHMWRLDELVEIPAEIRFLSCEPLLSALEFSNASRRPGAVKRLGMKGLDGIHLVIVGGESGPNARPMHVDWARSIRDQCQAVGVAFFFKQFGEWAPATHEYGIEGHVMPDDGMTDSDIRCSWIDWDGQLKVPSAHGLMQPVVAIARVGKKAAGRLLDGRTWDEMPAKGGGTS